MANEKDTLNRGQAKVHNLTNPRTGETKTVTQDEWQRDGKSLRDQGWLRDDVGDEIAAEEGTDTEDTAS